MMTSYCLQLRSGRYWINDISGKTEAVFLKLGTTNVHQKRNKMTPLLLLPWQQFCRWCCVDKHCNSRFFFKTKTICPTQSNDGTEDKMGSISVPSRTLCTTVDFFCFLTERDWGQKSCYGNSTKGVIFFFCDVHLWSQVSRTLLQYFQRYRLFSIFHILVANNMTSSLIKFA